MSTSSVTPSKRKREDNEGGANSTQEKTTLPLENKPKFSFSFGSTQLKKNQVKNVLKVENKLFEDEDDKNTNEDEFQQRKKKEKKI